MKTHTSKDSEDWYGNEQLHFAAGDGDLPKVKQLLKEGYSINSFDDSLSRTPLHCAAVGEHLDVVRYLIKAGADVNLSEEKKVGNTVLAEIAETCSLEMATALVDAGADPTIPGWMGLTALDRSAKRKRPEGRQTHKLLCEAAKRCNPHWPRLADFLKTGKYSY